MILEFKAWLKEYERTTNRTATIIGQSRGWFTFRDHQKGYEWKWRKKKMIEATERLRKRPSWYQVYNFDVLINENAQAWKNLKKVADTESPQTAFSKYVSSRCEIALRTIG